MWDSPQVSFDHFEILRTGFHCGPLRASPIQQDFEQRVRILVYADELAVGGHAGSLLARYFVCAAANEDRNRQVVPSKNPPCSSLQPQLIVNERVIGWMSKEICGPRTPQFTASSWRTSAAGSTGLAE